MDLFAVLAAPARRDILGLLQLGSRSVNQLGEHLDINQPAVSKHLKVLRQAGFVSCQGSAQQRIYRLEPGPFRTLEGWLAPYLRLWSAHLAALERHLDRKENRHEQKSKPIPGRPPRRRHRGD